MFWMLIFFFAAWFYYLNKCMGIQSQVTLKPHLLMLIKVQRKWILSPGYIYKMLKIIVLDSFCYHMLYKIFFFIDFTVNKRTQKSCTKPSNNNKILYMYQGIYKSHDIWNVKLFDVKKTDKICKGKTASSKLAISKHFLKVFSLFFFRFFTTITKKNISGLKLQKL